MSLSCVQFAVLWDSPWEGVSRCCALQHSGFENRLENTTGFGVGTSEVDELG